MEQFLEAIIKLLDSLEKIAEYEKEEFKSFFRDAKKNASLNPRDNQSSINQKILHNISNLLIYKVIELYGKTTTNIFHDPYLGWPGDILNQNPEEGDRSFIAETITYPHRWGMYISSDAVSWEQIFYEMCHESIHLLNPVVFPIDRNGNAMPNGIVSSLEEGVAVKFAEQMYWEYITPYTKALPEITPVKDRLSQYYDVFNAIKNIPDSTLAKIRAHFGKFSDINDSKAFEFLLSECLKNHLIKDYDLVTLSRKFVYQY